MAIGTENALIEHYDSTHKISLKSYLEELTSTMEEAKRSFSAGNVNLDSHVPHRKKRCIDRAVLKTTDNE